MLLFFSLALFVMSRGWMMSDLGNFAFDVEDGGWEALYWITVPLFLSAIPLFIMKKSAYKGNWWVHLLFCGLYPLIVAASVWLWELLGLVLMAGAFLVFSIGFVNDTEKDQAGTIYFWVVFIAYILVRLFGPHYGINDYILLALYGGYLLRHSAIILFKDNEYSSGAQVYYTVPLLISLFFAVLWAVTALF